MLHGTYSFTLATPSRRSVSSVPAGSARSCTSSSMIVSSDGLDAGDGGAGAGEEPPHAGSASASANAAATGPMALAGRARKSLASPGKRATILRGTLTLASMATAIGTPEASAQTLESRPAAPRIPPELWAVAVITLAGAILRFSTLTAQSYWVDEATTVHELHLSFGALLHQVHVNETTPPLYFVLAWVWTKLFGTGEAGLRSFSAVLGTGAIPVAYLCGRQLISRWAGVAAAAFAALSPFMIWYSQEARSYMLLGLLCGLSFLFFARAWRQPSTRSVVWWAVFSALAILTHFFAGFLVAPEGVLLLWRGPHRRRVLVAGAGVAAVQLAMLPLAVSDTHHPLSWIKAFPLSVRIQQIPVDLGLSTLYQSSLVTYGLWGAGVLAAIVAALLIVGGTSEQRRGAAVAAGLAAFVILVPIVIAELGGDYVVPRNFMPAWIPLAVLIGAACTVPRARIAGAALALVVLGGFVWAQTRIDQNTAYQRPNWRGVAAALGPASGRRAIVLYGSGFATQPLEVYMRGISWGQPPPAPVSVNEVDVVGSSFQTTAHPLPAGVSLLARRTVDDFLVERFLVKPAWNLTPGAIAQRAAALLGPGPPSPAVLIQAPARAAGAGGA